MLKMSLEHQQSDSGAQTDMSDAIFDPIKYQAWPSAAASTVGPASLWRSLKIS